MGIVARRIRRAIGWRGACYLVAGVVSIIALLSHTLPVSDTQAWVAIILPIGGLIVLGYRMRGYQKPQAVRPYQEVLTPLLASAMAFCLVLRPFGHDGETFLRGYRQSKRAMFRNNDSVYYSILTMEQVIARSARQALRLDTYALVDQNREVAPPGPIYLRASNEAGRKLSCRSFSTPIQSFSGWPRVRISARRSTGRSSRSSRPDNDSGRSS